MLEIYYSLTAKIVAYTKQEAASLSNGGSLKNGRMRVNESIWNGVLTGENGKEYEVRDGYIVKEVQAS